MLAAEIVGSVLGFLMAVLVQSFTSVTALWRALHLGRA